jgi:hypothetical protein
LSTFKDIVQCVCTMDVCTSKKRDIYTDPLLQALSSAGICSNVINSLTAEDANNMKLYHRGKRRGEGTTHKAGKEYVHWPCLESKGEGENKQIFFNYYDMPTIPCDMDD